MTGGPDDVFVSISERAGTILARIAREKNVDVVVVLNDGCCDGMGPVAIPESSLGVNDVRIGKDEGIEVYTPRTRAALREGYAVEIDVHAADDVGAFSLEVPFGHRLTARESQHCETNK